MSELISALELNKILGENTCVLDCRSDLTDRTKSQAMYKKDHISGAIFANLETDLSDPIIPNVTGRHPLPSVTNFQKTLQQWGITSEKTIVVYDQTNSMFAARAWWLLKWAGLTNVKVLDGGYQSWLDHQGAIDNNTPQLTASNITITPHSDWVVTADILLHEPQKHLILDARALARYQGAVEPLDAKAGHIPSAINADFSKNLQSNGQFLAATQLKSRFAQTADQSTICYCGSGVTACHNILAIVEAGYPMPKLYPGSWSEWITDDNRPIATGSEGDI